jgi:hypothetical protein
LAWCQTIIPELTAIKESGAEVKKKGLGKKSKK